MNRGEYIACICEGGAEKAIINLLLDHKKLIFQREDLLDESVLDCRNGKVFEERHLQMRFLEKITVFRILDSRRENFKVSRAYRDKIEVVNVITAPEIEMLIILEKGLYKKYKASHTSPSDFCKRELGIRNVKKPDFVKKYFEDIDVLMKCLKEYKRITIVKKDELTICDLLEEH